MQLFTLILALGFALASGNENGSTTGSPLSPDVDQEDPDSIITYGYPAHEGKAPYIVSLSFRKDRSNEAKLCGGTIIGNTWVLTAAQCLDGQDYVDIHYGSIWRWNGQFSHQVRKADFIKHHLWPRSKGNDIGLIRTPFIHFSSMVNRAQLPKFSQMNDQFENTWATACGWGLQANGYYAYGQYADRLQCADFQVMSNTECSKFYGYLPVGNMCVRTPASSSTCDGDNGGPLVTYNTRLLVGITSFRSSDVCTSTQPAGFTRITAHLDWIRQQSGIAEY